MTADEPLPNRMRRARMTNGYTWRPIADYETDPRKLEDVELGALASVWQTERERLADSEAFPRFNEKLRREWAIETGLIERVYEFDRGVTEILIERGIEAALIPRDAGPSRETVVSMIRDHEAAIDYVFDFVKGDRRLSERYIKDLHALLTRHQETAEGRDQFGRRALVPLEKGTYKERPNNPTGRSGAVHEYCPPAQVAPQMEALLEMHGRHDEVAPEVEAAWLHHRFTQIHPFQDGNGRVARALATLVLVKAGRFPLVVRSAAKTTYLDALETADEGDLQPLIGFFREIQRGEFVRALGLSRDVGRLVRAEDVNEAIRKELRQRQDMLLVEWDTAKDRAEDLREIVRERLLQVATDFEVKMKGLLEHVETFVDGDGDHGPRSHYFRQQIIEGARTLDYFANTETYRAWVRLVIGSARGNQSQILFSFHGVGHEFRGVLACSAVFFQRMYTGKNERETSPAKALARSVFQINYREDPISIEDRFRKWIEECIVGGQRRWRTAQL